jgi:hypothetical protein
LPSSAEGFDGFYSPKARRARILVEAGTGVKWGRFTPSAALAGVLLGVFMEV